MAPRYFASPFIFAFFLGFYLGKPGADDLTRHPADSLRERLAANCKIAVEEEKPHYSKAIMPIISRAIGGGKNLGTAFKISDDVVFTAAHNVAQRASFPFLAISELDFRLLPGDDSPIVFSDFDHFSRQENDLPHLRGKILRMGVGSGHDSDWALIKILPPIDEAEATAWKSFQQLPDLALRNLQSTGAIQLIGYPATCALFQDGRARFHKAAWPGSTIKRDQLNGWRIWMSSVFHGDGFVLAPGLNHGNSGAPIVMAGPDGPVAIGLLTGGEEYSGQGFFVQFATIWTDLTELGLVPD